VKSSTKDKIKGRIDEAKGKVKEKTGEAAGNSDLRDRGAARKSRLQNPTQNRRCEEGLREVGCV
jgi:uncharacterized protein YjbJ (UPF0337 family)